jgi:hypothetical protein
MTLQMSFYNLFKSKSYEQENGVELDLSGCEIVISMNLSKANSHRDNLDKQNHFGWYWFTPLFDETLSIDFTVIEFDGFIWYLGGIMGL